MISRNTNCQKHADRFQLHLLIQTLKQVQTGIETHTPPTYHIEIMFHLGAFCDIPYEYAAVMSCR